MANGDIYAQPRSMADGLGQRMQGMFGGFKRGANALNPYSNRLLAFGAGMLGGGPAGAARGLIAGSAMDRESADRRRQDAALQGLMGQEGGMLSGFSEPERAYLAANPDALNAVIGARLKGPDSTDDIREYQYAAQNGFAGSFEDFLTLKKPAGVNINTGDYKMPPGYRPSDPNNPDAGVEPIPGGPAEQVPGDLAARIGLTNAFLQKAPAIKERLKSGEATGVWDRARAGWDDSSTQADLYRQLESGSDALRRMLTGAGMPEGEAATYSRRYLPSYTDDATSVTKKLDGLVDELEHMKEAAMRGRGGAAALPASDDEGWTTLPDGRRIREVP